jgi:drug/metabolite transporter (DMT)-like permease
MVAGAFSVAGVIVIKGHISFSSEALSDIAQIGATLLVAYAVEMAWFVKESRTRGRKRENWVGFVAGIGFSSALGIMSAVALVSHEGSSNFLEAVGLVWTLFSVGLLGLLVALLPYLLYDLVHTLHAEYPDE